MTWTWVEVGFIACFSGLLLCVVAGALLKRSGQ